MELIEDTIDNGLVENVHIAPIGEFVGSDAEGKPVPEKMTVDSLTKLADKLNASDEVLCDIDHGAAKKGADKETQAAGWFTRFVVDPIKGLFGMLKLTKKGKELLQNREYRYTSPTFILDGNGEPIDLHSVSLTNLPAFKGHVNPILNTEASETLKQEEMITMEMTKEDLVALIKDTVVAMNTAPVEEKKEETKEACNAEEAKAEEVKTEETVAENACTEETKNEAPVEEVKAEETVAEVKEKEKEEPKKEEPKKEEVIKLEALNTAPVVGADVSGKSAWQNLHGDEFFKYLREHPEVR